jgi:hypothetical protein
MAKPSEKAEPIKNFLDQLTTLTFGTSRTESITHDKCVSCKGDATSFRNEISKREYRISGLCQNCQDEIFGVD